MKVPLDDAYLAGEERRQARARVGELAGVPSPPDQLNVRMRWPPNIDVVGGLLSCLDKPYNDAYGLACRPD